MPPFIVRKTWRVDWDLVIERRIRKLIKETAMLDRFKLIASSVWAFLAPFVKMFLTRAGKALLPIALEAVREVATSYGSGTAGAVKRDAAFKLIEQRIREQLPGIAQEVGASMINSAIEIGVQKLKAEG